MLAALIQRYDKKSFHFMSENLNEILQAVRCRILYLYLYIYQFIKSFLDKMSIFEEYGAFKAHLVYFYVESYPIRLHPSPVSILRKSISGRHRPVRVADGPMTARCRFT